MNLISILLTILSATTTNPLATTTPQTYQDTNKGIIVVLSRKYGVSEGVMLSIAKAESGFNEKADNASSTADGLFQIINGTWKEFKCIGDKYDPFDNTLCAVNIATSSGLHHWDASAHVWKEPSTEP